MLLEIWFSDDSPPAGLVKVEGDAPASFQGWLGLLQAISRALESAPAGQEPIINVARSTQSAGRNDSLINLAH